MAAGKSAHGVRPGCGGPQPRLRAFPWGRHDGLSREWATLVSPWKGNDSALAGGIPLIRIKVRRWAFRIVFLDRSERLRKAAPRERT